MCPMWWCSAFKSNVGHSLFGELPLRHTAKKNSAWAIWFLRKHQFIDPVKRLNRVLLVSNNRFSLPFVWNACNTSESGVAFLRSLVPKKPKWPNTLNCPILHIIFACFVHSILIGIQCLGPFISYLRIERWQDTRAGGRGGTNQPTGYVAIPVSRMHLNRQQPPPRYNYFVLFI